MATMMTPPQAALRKPAVDPTTGTPTQATPDGQPLGLVAQARGVNDPTAIPPAGATAPVNGAPGALPATASDVAQANAFGAQGDAMRALHAQNGQPDMSADAASIPGTPPVAATSLPPQAVAAQQAAAARQQAAVAGQPITGAPLAATPLGQPLADPLRAQREMLRQRSMRLPPNSAPATRPQVAPIRTMIE